MYSKFQLAKKYLHYYFTASSGKGHGIHSPFVFDFIKNILQDKTIYDCYRDIEKIRQQLLMQKTEIGVEDLGAGSSVIKTNKRVVADMAGSSLKPKKYAQLLFRIVHYYKPGTIIELGTSFGITTAYLAAGNEHAKVYTIEGSEAIAEIARKHLERSGPGQVELITGNFNDTLPGILKKIGHTGLAFIDGNHRKAPTLDYFHQLLSSCEPSSILIFDDIHWSTEMEEAWAAIRQHPSVTVSIDLFFIGIVFFNTDINHKQHYSIRF
ncbi:MAG: class I SAM-dependent methyltransferase [Chitinophagaceae bacterium]|nr:class I SAM-dependent methyltransferase [Chitinophagaceae bacterium]